MVFMLPWSDTMNQILSFDNEQGSYFIVQTPVSFRCVEPCPIFNSLLLKWILVVLWSTEISCNNGWPSSTVQKGRQERGLGIPTELMDSIRESKRFRERFLSPGSTGNWQLLWMLNMSLMWGKFRVAPLDSLVTVSVLNHLFNQRTVQVPLPFYILPMSMAIEPSRTKNLTAYLWHPFARGKKTLTPCNGDVFAHESAFRERGMLLCCQSPMESLEARHGLVN